MTAPLPTSKPEDWTRLGNLRQAILDDLWGGNDLWTKDIAEKRKVTRAVVMSLLFSAEAVSLCVYCQASGRFNGETCCACLGRGYNTKVKIG